VGGDLEVQSPDSGSVVTWRRAQMVLLSAQGMDVAAIAKVAFTSEDRVRDVIHNFNADGFESLYPNYKSGQPPKFSLTPIAERGRHSGCTSARSRRYARQPLPDSAAVGGHRSGILRAATGPWMCAPPAAAGRPERELLFLLARACRQALLR
jgi:hypothetical protein